MNGAVSDARWHGVSWELRDGRLTIRLDDVTRALNVDVSLAALRQQDPRVTVYIGARPFVPGTRLISVAFRVPVTLPFSLE